MSQSEDTRSEPKFGSRIVQELEEVEYVIFELR